MGACAGWDNSGSDTAVSRAIYGGAFGKESALPRTPSVDDLFAPMWRLEVQQQGSGQDPNISSWKGGIDHSSPRFTAEEPRSVPDPKRTPVDQSLIPSTSTSDDDHHQLVDDKKQKRMLSNRESARRSRLRKQQHLEELRSQLLELRGQNSQILGKLSVASQQFSQISHDNQRLRMQAAELGRQLQRLHREASLIHPDGLHAFGFGTSHLDPPGVAIRSSSPPPPCSAYAIVSDVLQGSSLCSS